MHEPSLSQRAGGCAPPITMQTAFQQSDTETMITVVNGPWRLWEVEKEANDARAPDRGERS